MKRFILSAFLAVTIIGIGTIAMASKYEVNQMVKPSLVDLYGDRQALGNKKLESNGKFIDNYNSLKTIASKNGIESNENIKGMFYYTEEMRNSNKLYRSLVRGWDSRNSTEGEKFLVALDHTGEKGLSIRYKTKDESGYREFTISEKSILSWMDLSNIYIKNDIVYVVVSNCGSSKLLKISLTSEKLLSITEFPVKSYFNPNHGGNNEAIVKEDKMYILSRSSDDEGNLLNVFTFDLNKEAFEYKQVACKLCKNVSMIDVTDNIANFGDYDPKENILEIGVYDILSDKLIEVSIDKKKLKSPARLEFTKSFMNGDKLYLIGEIDLIRNSKSAIAVFDFKKNSLEYLGFIDNGLIKKRVNSDIK